MRSAHPESEPTGASLGVEPRQLASNRGLPDEDGPRRTSWREMAIVAASLAVLAAAVFGTQTLHRGFFYDDWDNLARTRWPSHGHGILAAVADTWDAFGYRLALALYLPALYLPALYTVLDDHMAVHLAWIVVLAIALSTAFYVLLRELAFRRLEAGAVAALVLVYPLSDSTRLWVTAGTSGPTTVLFVIGVILLLRAFDAADRRRSLSLHVAGVVYDRALNAERSVLNLVGGARYGLAFVVNVGTRSVTRLSSQSSCTAAAATALPGPLVAAP